MRHSIATAVICAAFGSFAGCGGDAADAPVALPPSGAAYRSLSESERLAAVAACRDGAAAEADGVAARQIGEVDPRALRTQLDLVLTLESNRRRTFSELCAQSLPFATPAVRVSFAGAIDSGYTFTYQTRSDKPLTIRGAVSPPPRGGYVVGRREYGSSSAFRSRIGADGRFVMPTVRLRKQANNSFVVAIHSPPNALRKVRFSAICVDCLASGTPTGSN